MLYLFFKNALQTLMVVQTIALIASQSARAFPYSSRDNNNNHSCVLCHGNLPVQQLTHNSLEAPLISEYLSMDWKMIQFESKKTPPLLRIPEKHQVLPGTTYYNWKEKQMVEIYKDRCIDLFPDGNEFSCKFLSLKEITYLIRFKKGDLSTPTACCLLSKNAFWAPRPDVLKNMQYDRETIGNKGSIEWRHVDTNTDDGPFGYGILKQSNQPAIFWFEVINGWAQQEFEHVSFKKPDEKQFLLPEICQGQLDVCPEFQ